LRRDLSIREKALGPEHPDTAQSIDNLATLYMAMGNYAKAEPLLRRGLWIRDKAREHPDIGRGIDDILTSGAILTPKAERAPPTASIPKFPWPPPRASTEHQIHHKWLAEGDHTTLVDVAERLETVLGIAGFETWKYSSVPNGFALVTQIEQILPDGTPRPERFRTDLPSLSDLSFVEFLIALAKAPSGYYRVIVFVVTDTPFSQRETPPTESEARRWLDAGLNKLPASFSEVIYGEDYRTTALIYQFKKLSNQPATLVLPSLASARAHLERAQIWPVLTR
jgi:hypothetical protein